MEHGAGDNWLDWSRVIPALARTHRVDAPDMPGFGDSAKRIPSYSSTFYAQLLAALLDGLGVERTLLVVVLRP